MIAQAKSRRTFRFAVLLLSGSALAGMPMVSYADSIWTGTASDDWFTAGNWDANAVPTAATIAFIGTALPNPTVIDAATANVKGLVIGYGGGTGALTIQNGGELDAALGVVLGSQPGSSGTLVVTGTNSKLDDTVDLQVGGNGFGVMNIEDGAHVLSGSGGLASESQGVGVATVDGAGSQWDISGNLDVGYDGQGTLTISNGGAVTSNFSRLGKDAGASGTVLVTGTDATWNTGGIEDGLDGTGSVTVENGGAIVTPTIMVGADTGSVGTLTVGGSNSSVTASGGLTIASAAGSTGTLNIGAAVASVPAGAGTVDTPTIAFGAGTGTINFNHTSHHYVFAAAMSGSGTLNQIAGVTDLTGDSNLYTGPSNVEGGTLLVDGKLGAGSVNVQSGATLGGGGTIGGPVDIAAGGVLTGRQGQTLTMLDLTLASGADVDVDLSDPAAPALFKVTNSLSLDGTLNITTSTGFGAGVYRIMDYGGTLHDNGLDIGTTPTGTTAADFTVQTSVAGQVNLIDTANVAGAQFSFWDAGAANANNYAIDGGSGIWSTTVPNWTDANGAANHAMQPQPGFAIFEAAPGTVTVDDSAGAVGVTGMQFATDGYTVGGGAVTLTDTQTVIRVGDGTMAGAGYKATISSVLTGAGGLDKTDLGTLVLTGENDYTGTTTITNGTLQLGDGGASGTGAVAGDIVDNGQLVFDNSLMLHNVTGNISGTGSVTVLGLTDWTGTNTYTGGTTIASSGALVLGSAGTTGSIVGDIVDNGRLEFGRTDHVTFGGVISGDGDVEQESTGTLTLSAMNTYKGGTMIDSGTMIGSASSFGSGSVTSDATFVIDQASDATFANVIDGNGAFIKRGAGALDLTGTSTFAGLTTVEGGRLAVNGSLAQSGVLLDSGATLGGNGTVGSFEAQAGSIVAPGNSIGTLSVAGVASFDANSIYQVEVNAAGQSDKIVAGAAAIDGGTVQVLAGSGSYAPSTQYTIVSTTLGVTGTFDNVTSNLVFLSPELTYDADDVFLTLARNSVTFQSVGETRNQIATGGGVESVGDGNPVYGAVLSLDAPAARAAFDQLSGEVHASAKTAMIEDSHFVRDAATNRIRAAFGGADTQDIVASIPGDTQAVAADPNRATLWSQAFGSWGSTDSDGNAAALDRSIGGVFVGGDVPVFDDWRLGALAGYSHSSFDTKARASAGSSDNYDVGLYGGTQWGALGLRVGAAYTWHAIDTGRSVAFPAFADSLSGKYDAGTAQMFGDLGYRIDAGSFSFEPFAGLAYVNLRTDGFSEEGGDAALSAASQNTAVTFSTLGLRGSEKIDLGGAALTARGTLGWRHAYGQDTPVATLAMSGGDPFTVAGVPIARDSLLIDAGLDMTVSRSITLGLSYSGQIAYKAHDNGLKADLEWTF